MSGEEEEGGEALVIGEKSRPVRPCCSSLLLAEASRMRRAIARNSRNFIIYIDIIVIIIVDIVVVVVVSLPAFQSQSIIVAAGPLRFDALSETMAIPFRSIPRERERQRDRERERERERERGGEGSSSLSNFRLSAEISSTIGRAIDRARQKPIASLLEISESNAFIGRQSIARDCRFASIADKLVVG